jgi:uncharacterized protein (DUF1499 family)
MMGWAVTLSENRSETGAGPSEESDFPAASRVAEEGQGSSSSSPKFKAKSMLWILAGVIVVALFVFKDVDDWGRDLTTNTASTDDGYRDLKPITIPRPPDQTATYVTSMVATLPGWGVESGAVPMPAEDGTINLHFVRTTKLMRFKDDVNVRLVPGEEPETTVVHIRSQSRVGQGDLGQNPRNIRELLGLLSAGI